MKSIFVGNLPWSVTDADLEAKFSEFGAVSSARIVSDKFSGRSRGFGFVDMDDEAAQRLLQQCKAISGEIVKSLVTKLNLRPTDPNVHPARAETAADLAADSKKAFLLKLKPSDSSGGFFYAEKEEINLPK